MALRRPIRSYCRELSVRDRLSAAPLDSLASTWVGPKALEALVCPEFSEDLERKAVPAVLVAADNALADPVVAGELSLVAVVVVRAAARVVEAHSAAGGADVFCASR